MTLDSTSERYHVVTAPAEVDIASSNALRDDIDAAIAGNRWVIVDLSAVGFIDSSGLTVLLACHQSAIEHGGKLVLAGPSERTLKMLHITQLDSVLEIYPTVESVPAP